MPGPSFCVTRVSSTSACDNEHIIRIEWAISAADCLGQFIASGPTKCKYAIFASPSFDVNEYANAILAGEPYPPPALPPVTATKTTFQSASNGPATLPPKTPIVASTSSSGQEDLSVALAKLNFGIDDVSKQLRGVIVNHHEDLLARAAGVSELEHSLLSVRQGLDTVGVSVDKLKTKIRVPYESLESNLSRLQRLQVASDALRRISRFVTLSRRLETQMAELDRIKAAPAPAPTRQPPPSISTDALSSPTAERLTPGANRPELKSAASGSAGLLLEPEGDLERVVSQAALYISELATLTTADPIASTANADGDAAAGPDSSVTPTINQKNSPDADAEEAFQAPEPIGLEAINVVSRGIPFVEEARARVQSEMEGMVLGGLDSLNQSMLASALQTAANLNVLPSLVLTLLTDLNDAVEERVRFAFDVTALAREVGAGGKDATQSPTAGPGAPPNSAGLMYRSRVRTEPTNVTAGQWATALWARMEVLVEDMAACCVKVYALERVLQLKKDSVTRVSFLDEVMQTMENKPSSAFWHALAAALEKHSKDAATSSTFLQQTLSNGYPRFLRLFHEFFAKIAVRTDTVYTESNQSPETLLILRSISRFETVYLSRSTARLNETIASALSGGIRAPPGAQEGLAMARVAANELDSARFDVLLVRSVARNVVSAVDVLMGRMNTLISRDRMATQLSGPTANPPQVLNAQLASTLYACWSQLKTLENEYHPSVINILTPTLKNLKGTFDRLVDPLISTIRRDLSAIIARLHRVDFSDRQQPGAMADPLANPGAGSGGPSPYMKDLSDKLDFIRTQLLTRYAIGPLRAEWALMLVTHVVRTFVLHASVARPLGERGKLMLTTDMAELEFALSAMMVFDEGAGGAATPGGPTGKQANRGSMRKPAAKLETIGDDYKALRGLRPLLFLDTPLLASPSQTPGLTPLLVIHHIIVRSSHPVLTLPHALHDWSEAEYVRWVEDHDERERLALIETCLAKWEGEVKRWEGKNKEKGTEGGEDIDYVLLVKTVLQNARETK
ncbi:hypothetical protein DL93DRAFT_2148754 [Clavulina sp. PMI_390]|nr:hypothetical protein DL93DRAFT_2148754 [Clavulina sp. PMI_390]